MGILVRENNSCLVHCFTCGYRAANLAKLFEDLEFFGDIENDLVQEARDVDKLELDVILDNAAGYQQFGYTGKDYPVYPAAEWEPYSHLWHSYLEKRGIGQNAALAWDIGFDKREHRVLIPVKDVSGHYVGAIGRIIHNQGDPRYKNYWPARSESGIVKAFDKGKFLVGEHMADPAKTTILVEGAFDAICVWQQLKEKRAFYNVMATMGVRMTDRQVQKVLQLSSEVIIMFDNDYAGHEGVGWLAKSIGRRIRTLSVNWNALLQHDRIHDPTMRNKARRQMKDPSSLGAQVIDLLQTAGPVSSQMMRRRNVPRPDRIKGKGRRRRK